MRWFSFLPCVVFAAITGVVVWYVWRMPQVLTETSGFTFGNQTFFKIVFYEKPWYYYLWAVPPGFLFIFFLGDAILQETQKKPDEVVYTDDRTG